MSKNSSSNKNKSGEQEQAKGSKAANKQEINKTLVVGLGASAGGLEALKVFFESVPENPAMAFIVIVHLSPDHGSSMAELLQAHTSLKVLQVKQKTEIKADHVYVIPPKKILLVEDNYLKLKDTGENEHKPEAVDLLFRSLGEVKGSDSACIILSGAGSDGSVGIKTIKEHGGFSIAQEPSEAKYDSMPQSAIDTGCVDKILPLKKMAKELLHYKKHRGGVSYSDDPENLSKSDEEVLSKVFSHLRSKTEHDFSHYKRASVLRRIERRMHVNHCDSLSDYLKTLNKNADEAQELFKDLLISVTNFFRNPEAFKALEREVIPELFKNKQSDGEVRVWVPGCATGEEAYSIAMLLHEYAATVDHPPNIQVFATDIDENAIQIARAGRYPQAIAADLTEQRLKRFFYKDGHEYQVKEELRKMILFTKHNLLGNPPFSNQDLISCRNLLIYLNRELQGEVFNLFHYALRSEGSLFLGNSDSSLEGVEMFTHIDKKHRIYRQSSRSQSKIRLPDFPLKLSKSRFSSSHSWKMTSKTKSDFDKLHREIMTRQYTPPSVIINKNNDVLHAIGGINRYLEYADGEPSRNILEMVIPELRQPLRSMLFEAKKDEKKLPLQKQIKINVRAEQQVIELNVHKVKEPNFPKDLMYIVFRKIAEAKTAVSGTISRDSVSDEETGIVEALEKELKNTKEQLQISSEDYETSNEELRASNEELQSMNEELQSTAEELETSQEELQSVNEELKTVNQELESKIKSLSEANNDLKNLMDATEIGIIFTDREFRVKRFTTKATEFFNLTPSDVGRPLEHFTHRFDYDGILDDIKTARDSSEKIKREVSDENGHSYDMRLTPYQTTDNGIEGVVITFVDVTELKAAEAELREKIEQIKELQRQILRNDVSERWQIGQYLHDNLAQNLLAAEFMIGDIRHELKSEKKNFGEELDKLKSILKQSIAGARDMSHEIVPIDVQQEGMIHAFNNLVKHSEKLYNIHCVIEGDGVMDKIDDIEVATNLYRIAHEALKNAANHGHAKNAVISLDSEDEFLYLNIEDDGDGFEVSEDEGGMGLNIMRHRMELLGGTFNIKKSSASGKSGVHISCKVPIDG